MQTMEERGKTGIWSEVEELFASSDVGWHFLMTQRIWNVFGVTSIFGVPKTVFWTSIKLHIEREDENSSACMRVSRDLGYQHKFDGIVNDVAVSEAMQEDFFVF